MLISELAREVHVNAVSHGWWDEERSVPEIIALIHSEWSEALEEARAGRPMVWHGCTANGLPAHPCETCTDCVNKENHEADSCPDYHGKPEGIAVELIDGCIRILDYIGKLDVIRTGSEDDVDIEKLYSDNVYFPVTSQSAVSVLVAHLHLCTAEAMRVKKEHQAVRALQLLLALSIAMRWVREHGVDPLAILLEKHEYNKSRPYKHGKRF